MAVYYVYSGAGGSANGSSWANAYTTLATAFSGKAAGDTFYVAHDHAESSTVISLLSPGTISNPGKVVCVNRAGSVPPVSADRRTTATVSTTANNSITIDGFTHYDGIIFTAGTGASSSASIILTTTSANYRWLRFDNCSLRLGITNTGSRVWAGGSGGDSAGTVIELNNTTMSFAHAGHTVGVVNKLRWTNTASAILGTAPTTLFSPTATRGGSVECIGVDLSATANTICLGTGSTAQSFSYRFVDCKLNASATKSSVPSGYGSIDVDFIRSGSSGVNYAVYRHRVSGLLIEETTIVRTGGASDGTTPIAWKITTTANCSYSMPFECPPIAIWNDTTGSAKTATVEGIWGGGAVPNDDDIWVEVEYLGDASSPQGSFVNDGKADLLATAAGQASSSETWGGSTTKFKLSVSFTAQQRGWIYARVKVARASSTLYVDPLVVLS